MSNFNYEKWSEIYHNKKILKLMDYLDNKEIEIAKKLGIEIKDEMYSEYEYDIVKQELLAYYPNDEEDPEVQEELKQFQKSLDDVGVTQEEYDSLLKKFDNIDELLCSHLKGQTI